MIKVSIAFSVLAACGAVQADELTTCRSPGGHTYYHSKGAVPKEASGWKPDSIPGGVFSLVQGADGSMDVLYVDARKKPISATQDGAVIRLIRSSKTNITVFVFYKEAMTEIYSFFQERDGSSKFTLLQNRTGDGALIEKSSLLMGPCDPIKFEQLR